MGGKRRPPKETASAVWPLEGLNTDRLRSNPLEKDFAEVWAEENTAERRNPLLAYILDRSGGMPMIPSDRDWVVANTVVQWLGSTVGQAFLRDVYIRR